MSRNGLILCCIVCAASAGVWISCPKVFAQGLPASGPSQSNSFLTVPTEPATPTNPYLSNPANTNYPETNAGATGNSLPTGLAQSGVATTGTNNPSFPQPINQPVDATLQASQYQNSTLSPSANPYLPLSLQPEQSVYFEEAWSWQYLPDGVLYQSYLAGPKEPRFASQWVHEKDEGWLWDVTLGGRTGVLRYGTVNSPWPEGWQLDIEGAAFPRLNLDHDRDVDAVDFRFGVPITVRRGPWQGKFAYYHLSSHLGDEYMVRHLSLERINYVRDCFVLGVGYFPNPNIRLYSEADWAFNNDGGSKPWKFQFGIEYSPIEPTQYMGLAAPFFAINSQLSEEVDYSGNLTVETGLQWRGQTGHLARIGLIYYNGMSDMYQFYRKHEEQIGLGVWYDF